MSALREKLDRKTIQVREIRSSSSFLGFLEVLMMDPRINSVVYVVVQSELMKILLSVSPSQGNWRSHAAKKKCLTWAGIEPTPPDLIIR